MKNAVDELKKQLSRPTKKSSTISVLKEAQDEIEVSVKGAALVILKGRYHYSYVNRPFALSQSHSLMFHCNDSAQTMNDILLAFLCLPVSFYRFE